MMTDSVLCMCVVYNVHKKPIDRTYKLKFNLKYIWDSYLKIVVFFIVYLKVFNTQRYYNM